MDKTTASVTFSGQARLVDAFQAHARLTYGNRGVSRAGREAMEEWLTKRGVEYSEGQPEADEWLRLCRDAKARGVDPRHALTTALEAVLTETAATTS